MSEEFDQDWGDEDDFDTIEQIFHASPEESEMQYVALGFPRSLLDQFYASYVDVYERGDMDPDKHADIDNFSELALTMLVAAYSMVMAAEMMEDSDDG